MMRVLFDIGHPAHVHYFKHTYGALLDRGDGALVIARDKEVSHDLLDSYGMPYVSRGKGSNSVFGKLALWPKLTGTVLKHALAFKPDLLVSFSSPYAAGASRLLGKPHVAFDDTENAGLNRLFCRPFTALVVSPDCYEGEIAANQELFNGFMELSYLHPNYFKPRPQVKELLGLEPDEKYTILRFVSWTAAHDLRHKGLSIQIKREAVEKFSQYGRVFVSSEGALPEDMEQFRFNLRPDWMHDALYYAQMVYGESATMASEAAMCGVPAIYLDNVGRGYTRELERKYGLVFNFTESESDQFESIRKGEAILKDGNSKNVFVEKRQRLLGDKIDVTKFLLEVIDRYRN
jgi:predicted glycosyltransferase